MNCEVISKKMTSFWKVAAYVAYVAIVCGAVVGWHNYKKITHHRKLVAVASAVRIQAEQGDTKSQSQLGHIYYHGEGVPQDYSQAFRWYSKAAEQGDVKAQYAIGYMYYFGENVPKDYSGNNILEESLGLLHDPNGKPFRAKWQSAFSGLPKAKRSKRNIVIIQAYVDEAGGKGQSSVFVFSALLASVNDWETFSDQWQAILDERPSIKYFKYYEASHREKQFQGFTPEERNEKIKKLLVPMRGLLEVFCIADMAAFAETLGKYNERPLRDPYFQQFNILIMAIGLTLLDLGFKERFEIVFDEHRIFGPKAKAWYPIVRDLCDDELKTVLPIEPRFETDQEYLPLQAADMIAGFRRAWNDNSLKELEWLKSELEEKSGILLSANSQYLDGERMRGIVELSYSHEYVKKSHELMREYKRKLGQDWKPPYMSNKRTTPEFVRFNETMQKLVKVPHSEIKAKLDAEKAAKRKPKKTSASRRASGGKD